MTRLFNRHKRKAFYLYLDIMRIKYGLHAHAFFRTRRKHLSHAPLKQNA